ncbi:methyl-accepting chemotaxis protein [Azospirillum sp.]|uniref:methyl-accepting chemotaxis protein n=1 Tax=Azospirillum sp. TaxID=34012 RepID=UPI003D75BF6B
MSLNNVRVVNKILLTLALVAVLALGLTGAALVALKGMDRNYTKLLDGEATASLWLARSNSLLNATARDVYLMIAEQDEAKVRKAAEALDSDARGTIERMEKALVALPDLRADAQTLRQSIEGLKRVADEVKLDALKNNDAAAQRVVAERFDPAYMDARLMFRALIDRVDRQLQAASDQVTVDANAASTWMLIVAGVGVVVCFGVAILLARRTIAAPIERITVTMHDLAAGKLDVAVDGAERGDEIGGMARAVQVFKDNAVERVRLEAAAAEERQGKERRAAEVERLIRSFEQSVSGILATVASATTELERTAESMTDTAHRTNERATAAAAAAEEASTNVQTVASATEELTASIGEISAQVARSTSIANQAVGEADQTNARVQGLVEQAQRIGEIVQLINDIASQTNLLALNATIEAARAGEMGKGFAVVASEVKHLANQTAKATEDIGQQIAAMQGATNGAAQAIGGIGRTIATVSEVATSIASAIEEQGAATSEIARNVQEAAGGTRAVSTNVADVSEAATHTGAAASQVLGASGELARQADHLKGEIERFLSGIRAA